MYNGSFTSKSVFKPNNDVCDPPFQRGDEKNNT